MYRPIDALPVLAREGTLIPVLPEGTTGNDTAPPDALEVWMVPGADGSFTLWEDRDDDRFADRPKRDPGHRARKSNVWMAPGARPVAEKKPKAAAKPAAKPAAKKTDAAAAAKK